MTPIRRVLMIVNPVAGNRRRSLLRRVVDRLERAGVEIDLRETAQRGDAERLARELAPQGYDVVVAAGGDGTIGEVVNGLGGEHRAAAVPPLAIVPLGTANVFAAEIGLRRRAPAIAATIMAGRPRRIFTGRANGRRFLMMAGAGLDAEVVAAVDPALKRRLGKLAYVIETWRQMFRYGFPVLSVTADGRTFRAVTAVACKGRRYGGPHLFAPGADVARPEFELVMIERGGPLRITAYALALGLGLLPRMPGVRRLRAAAIGVAGPAGAPVQGDGDLIARLPLAVAIDPEPLTVLYPPDRT